MVALTDRIGPTAAMLEGAAASWGITVSADLRVSERDAARLLSYSPSQLKALRQEGKGPASYQRGIAGCRISYRLTDLAAWIEKAREDW